MCRWSLRSLFIVVALCGVASRLASEAIEAQNQERVLEKLRGIGPTIRAENARLPWFG